MAIVKSGREQISNMKKGLSVLNTIVFVAGCMALGQTISLIITSLVFDFPVYDLQRPFHEAIGTRDAIMMRSVLSSLFCFLIIPATYLFFLRRASEHVSWTRVKVNPVSLFLSCVAMFTVVPLVSTLAMINEFVEFPHILTNVETHLKSLDEKAHQITNVILTFHNYSDLLSAIVVIAIVPGITEELFFRGMVQSQLQTFLQNNHLAVVVAASLFSIFHFEFYGLMPRLAYGILLGYIFLWSNNVWYSCIVHMGTNLMAVGSVYFGVPPLFNNADAFLTILIVLVSSAITVFLLVCFRNQERIQPSILHKSVD